MPTKKCKVGGKVGRKHGKGGKCRVVKKSKGGASKHRKATKPSKGYY